MCQFLWAVIGLVERESCPVYTATNDDHDNNVVVVVAAAAADDDAYVKMLIRAQLFKTSSLRVILLTVLADSIYNILIFLLKKNVSSFCTAKATHIFFSAKSFSISAYHWM